MKQISMWNLTPIAAVALLLASFVAVNARAQQSDSKYANATITVVTTANGDDNLHFSSRDCGVSLSGEGIVVDIDGTCWGWNQGPNVPRGLWMRIAQDKISFRHDGKEYVITDATTVKHARELLAPLLTIFEQQNKLGNQERALGEKQRSLGEQQRDVKVEVPDMSADFAKVEADAKRLIDLGAARLAEIEEGGYHWVTLSDPEGNEFDLVATEG